MNESLADKVRSIQDHCSFLLVSIMAHGYKGHVVGEDGSRGQLNDLIKVVDLNLKEFVPVVSIPCHDIITISYRSKY